MGKRCVSRDWLPPLCLAVLAAAVVVVMIIRFQAAAAPLERDEGEYALMGQLILDGTPPYIEAANMKFPGTYYAYAAILAVFGQTATGVHMGLLAVNLLSTVILYLLARPLLGTAGAALAGAAFIIMSSDNSVLGLAGHATQFVVMFALAGIWLLQQSSNSERRMPLLWGSGLCLGLALLMKQPGVFFALFGFLWVLYGALRRRPISWKRLLLESGSLAGGIVLPCAVVLALMAHQGVLDRFWFWTVDYAGAYATEMDLKRGIVHFQREFIPIFKHNPAIWCMAFAGMIGIWFTESGRKVAPFLLALFFFSFLAVCPGLIFRSHYFVQLLPATALYAGAAVWALEKAAARYTAKSKAIQFVMIVAVMGFSLTGAFSTWRIIAALTPEQFSHWVYGPNPFAESAKVAAYIKKNTKPEDRIAVMGSEPEICFYAHRKPATEYMYMFALMEPQPFALRMQEEMIAQVEKSEAPFLVLATSSSSWLEWPEYEKKVFPWLVGYINNYYQPVIVAYIYPDPDRDVWLMAKEGDRFPERPGSSLLIVHKRKTAK